MLHFTVILCDTILIATMEQQQPVDERRHDWLITVTDARTGKTASGKWTPEQLCAVLTLAQGAGEEKWSGYWAEKLYAIAEPLFKDWPAECRPIP